MAVHFHLYSKHAHRAIKKLMRDSTNILPKKATNPAPPSLGRSSPPRGMHASVLSFYQHSSHLTIRFQPISRKINNIRKSYQRIASPIVLPVLVGFTQLPNADRRHGNDGAGAKAEQRREDIEESDMVSNW